MKKYIIPAILSILMISLVFGAGVLTKANYPKMKSMTAERQAQFEISSGGQIEYKPDTDEIYCDEDPYNKIPDEQEQCWVRIDQTNVTHTEWRGQKYYCSKYQECELDKEGNQIDPECNPNECLEYTAYKMEQIQEKISKYSEDRRDKWLDAEIMRKARSPEAKVDAGRITS